jgi:hypothetical protein
VLAPALDSRDRRSDRSTTLGAVLACALFLLTVTTAPAQAQAQAPMDSPHQPPTIANPNVTAHVSPLWLELDIGFGLSCPSGQPVPVTRHLHR